MAKKHDAALADIYVGLEGLLEKLRKISDKIEEDKTDDRVDALFSATDQIRGACGSLSYVVTSKAIKKARSK